MDLWDEFRKFITEYERDSYSSIDVELLFAKLIWCEI